jgi:hypothetical protein
MNPTLYANYAAYFENATDIWGKATKLISDPVRKRRGHISITAE